MFFLVGILLLVVVLEVHASGTWVGFHKEEIDGGQVAHSVATLYLALGTSLCKGDLKLVLGFDPIEVRLKVGEHELSEEEADEMLSPGRFGAGGGDDRNNSLSGVFYPGLNNKLYFVVMWSWTPLLLGGEIEEEGEELEMNEPPAAAPTNTIATVLHAWYIQDKSGPMWRCEWGFLEVDKKHPRFFVVPDVTDQQQQPVKYVERTFDLDNLTVGISDAREIWDELESFSRNPLVRSAGSTRVEFREINKVNTAATHASPPIKLYFENDVVGDGSSIVAEKLTIDYVPDKVKLEILEPELGKEEVDAEIRAIFDGSKNVIDNNVDPTTTDKSNEEVTLVISSTHYRRLYLVVLWTYTTKGMLGHSKEKEQQRSIATVFHAWYQASEGRWKREWGFLQAGKEPAEEPHGGSSQLLPPLPRQPHFTVPGEWQRNCKKQAVDRTFKLGNFNAAFHHAYVDLLVQSTLEAVGREGFTSVALIKTEVTQPYHRVSIILHPKRGGPLKNQSIFEKMRQYSFRYTTSSAEMILATPNSGKDESTVPLLLPGFSKFESDEIVQVFKMYPEVSRRAYLVIVWPPTSTKLHRWRQGDGECLRRVIVSLVTFDEDARDWRHPKSSSPGEKGTAHWGHLCRYTLAEGTSATTHQGRRLYPFFFSPPLLRPAGTHIAYGMEWDDMSEAEADKVKIALEKLFE